MSYSKFNQLLRKGAALKVLLGVAVLALMATAASAGSFTDPGSSFYGEELRPPVSNQLGEEVLNKVGWTQNLNKQIPLNLTFKDEDGNSVKLQKYFGEKPVLVENGVFLLPDALR